MLTDIRFQAVAYSQTYIMYYEYMQVIEAALL